MSTPSSTLNRSVELGDFPLSTKDTKSSSFAPLHRTDEVENLHDPLNDGKQSTSSPSTSTKKVLTKCFTVIGDGTDK